jgi:hypothetical protein
VERVKVGGGVKALNENTRTNEKFIKTNGESGPIWLRLNSKKYSTSIIVQRQPWDNLSVVDFKIKL